MSHKPISGSNLQLMALKTGEKLVSKNVQFVYQVNLKIVAWYCTHLSWVICNINFLVRQYTPRYKCFFVIKFISHGDWERINNVLRFDHVAMIKYLPTKNSKKVSNRVSVIAWSDISDIYVISMLLLHTVTESICRKVLEVSVKLCTSIFCDERYALGSWTRTLRVVLCIEKIRFRKTESQAKTCMLFFPVKFTQNSPFLDFTICSW